MPFMEKPCAPASEKNREPILEVLRDHFGDRRAVLEIGSGTGQHAIFFAACLPHLIWQTSDRTENLPGIKAWLDETGLANIVVHSRLVEKQRRELLGARVLGVLGQVQREGEVVHLIAKRPVDLSSLLGRLPTTSRNFH